GLVADREEEPLAVARLVETIGRVVADEQALARPRQPDLSSLPGGRRPMVLPRGRQPVLLGQALQGARPRAPRRRSALRLLAPAHPEQRGSPADPRGAFPRAIPRRVARRPGRPRHSGGARAAAARLLR